jgi:hypothetical protein
MSYLDTFKNADNFDVRKTEHVDFKYCTANEYIDIKFIEAQYIEKYFENDTTRSVKTVKAVKFSDWITRQNIDKNNIDLITIFDQLQREKKIDMNLINQISQEKDIAYNDSNDKNEQESIRAKFERNSGELINFPDQLKIDFLVVKTGTTNQTKYFVHSRVAIRYLGDISKEFRAKVESVFDRYLQGDLKICNETISNLNRREGVLTNYECQSLAINDLNQPDDEYSMAVKASKGQGSLLDLRSMQKLQSMFGDVMKHYIIQLQSNVELKLDSTLTDIKNSSKEVENKVDNAIMEKEKTMQVDMKSRQCIYCMRIHANNIGASNHLNNTCREKKFSDQKLIIDGYKLLDLIKLLQDQKHHNIKKIDIEDTNLENISAILTLRKKIKQTKKYKIIKTTYDFNNSNQRWDLYKVLSKKFYLKLEDVLTESSRKFLKNNADIFKLYFNQNAENLNNEEDIISLDETHIEDTPESDNSEVDV